MGNGNGEWGIWNMECFWRKLTLKCLIEATCGRVYAGLIELTFKVRVSSNIKPAQSFPSVA